MDKDLLRGLSEKEVEIEHLKTKVVELTMRTEVMKDMEKDLAMNKDLLTHSEHKRKELQDFIQMTAVQMGEDAAKNKKWQEEVRDENKRLLEDIERLKALVMDKEREKMEMRVQMEKEKMDMQLNMENIINQKDIGNKCK